MAKFTSVNNLPATGAEAVYRLKQTLVNASWSVKASSDGTTYNSTGDQITGTTSLAATNAWFRIQDPGTRREFVFQRTTNNTLWRIKFSESSKFTGGTPGVTQVPSATDEGVIFGSGTDASPTGAALFNTDATYRCHAIAFSDAVATNVYSFFFFTTDYPNSGNIRTRFFVDGLSPVNAADVSPLGIFLVNSSGAFSAGTLMSGTVLTWVWGWYKYGLSGAAFTNWKVWAIANIGTAYVPATTAGNGVGPDIYSGNELLLKLVGLYRASTDTNLMFKGFCQRLAYVTNFARSYPFTESITSNSYVLTSTDFAVPWEDNTAAQM